jgi:glycosyltransferase involved in cell wall biosynthesis
VQGDKSLITQDLLKVSIITACYNSAKTIEQTITSVINQTYPNIEYIIIDGGSIDGTLDIIKKYETKVDYWKSEPDRGISDAWNKGLQHAIGDYIGFIGADDLYEPDAIKRIVNAFADYEESRFIFGNIYTMDKAIGTRLAYLGDPDFGKSMRYDMTMPHLSVFVKRECFERYGYFDLNYKVAMDHEFLLRLIVAGVQGKYVDQFFGTMYIGGISNRNYISCYREIARTARKYGGNRIYIQYWLLLKIVRAFTRKVLENYNILWLVRQYREIFSKRVHYLD